MGTLLSNHIARGVNCSETFWPQGSSSVTKHSQSLATDENPQGRNVSLQFSPLSTGLLNNVPIQFNTVARASTTSSLVDMFPSVHYTLPSLFCTCVCRAKPAKPTGSQWQVSCMCLVWMGWGGREGGGHVHTCKVHFFVVCYCLCLCQGQVFFSLQSSWMLSGARLGNWFKYVCAYVHTHTVQIRHGMTACCMPHALLYTLTEYMV